VFHAYQLFHFNTECVADFIQGRAPATVGSAHYLNKVQQAKDEYGSMTVQA
jgi:intergrase/recombinase